MSAHAAFSDPRHLAPRHPEAAPGGLPPVDDQAAFTERIDGRLGAIHAQGHLTVRAADMVCGTVEALRRSGHDAVVVDLREVSEADEDGLHALHSLAVSVRDDGGRLTLVNAPRSPGM
ncbi:STAS domain-containing protein [Blastococcus capsensis]|uniref:STAS domain-containing protein n=1 Tax=Blastococcus capsensis TaxID=1564163 RepID=UPI002541A047|nr:STAS domain-containing protein [Blastococcus capsensis]MDK3257653.1 STAS domain-containing protein [Blastococcus capsensis]